MQKFLDIIDHVQLNGVHKGDRTGTGTTSAFGYQRRFDLRNNQLPVVTTKKIHLKSIIHELAWMLSGDTDVDYLITNGVRIWNEWVKPETAIYAPLSISELVNAMNQVVGGQFVLLFGDDTGDNEYVVLNSDPTDRQVIINQATWDNVEKYGPVPAATDEGAYCRRVYQIITGKEPKRLVGGSLGPVYGKQWRNVEDTRIISRFELAEHQARGFKFVTPVVNGEFKTDSVVVTRQVDQVQDLLNQLATNPDSRRLIICAWNPAVVEEQALPPCHTLLQFWTRELSQKERLALSNEAPVANDLDAWLDQQAIPKRAISSQLYCRSQDVFLGTPFNITFYSILTHLLAKQFNMVAEEFIWTGGDVHIYDNHQEQVELQLSRSPYQAPTIQINDGFTSVLDFKFDDITVLGYQSHAHIAGQVAV